MRVCVCAVAKGRVGGVVMDVMTVHEDLAKKWREGKRGEVEVRELKNGLGTTA